MTDRDRLEELTRRWRERHDAQRPAIDARPAADPSREVQAAVAFPFRDIEPERYVEEHGADMVGFTYDEARYADPDLDAWLLEVGRLLREGR
jgi:hypothetical protein